MKKCTRCGIEKSVDSFWYDKRKERHVAACKECSAKAKREYRVKNAEYLRSKNREWQQRNPEKCKAANRRYLERNPGLAAKRTQEWRAANRERALEAQRQANRKLKVAAYQAYGGFRCACCGETEEPFLSLDHIHNDGAQHRKVVDRRKIYKWLSENGYPKGFQVLCMNCNFGKARNGGICPHQMAPEGSTTMAQASTAKRPEARGPSKEGEDIVSSHQ
jgi:hypothetical protein